MEEGLTFDEYRTGYISTRYDISDNCARALQAFELGLSVSGVAKAVGVTEGTANSYKATLMAEVSPYVTLGVGTKGHGRLDIWGDRDVSNYEDYGYDDGVRHAQEANDSGNEKTDSRDQLDSEFRERRTPLNKGMAFDDIPKELITIAPEVEA